MNMMLRPYRKSIAMSGLIYLAGMEQNISIVNISITGVLAQLEGKKNSEDIREIFDSLIESAVIDLYIPELRMAGETYVIRVDLQDDQLLIALEFKNMNYEINDSLYQRRAYRKNLPGPGRILIDGEYLEFNAVNVSVEGMMIRVHEILNIEPGLITYFNFERLELAGKTEVKWVDRLSSGYTLIGLEYLEMEKSSIKGIPNFRLALAA